MEKRRVLAIGLDGYEESLERRLIEAGELPALARLRERSTRFLLDHGAAQRSGLAWEHLSTGLAPERAGRWAALHFDPETYEVWQEGTRLEPFAARLSSNTVVFDAPYFDLARAPHVRGVVGWGVHDPGAPKAARPDHLLSEFEERFGKYPAERWIYGVVWSSAERAREMGESLARSVSLRARAARWLLGERLKDWELALVVVSEPHSAVEGLWHGVEGTHPLHRMPSAGPAREGLINVYRGVDRLVAELSDAFPDAALVVFSMGGMGANHSDTASMALLAELLYRREFGRALMRQPDAWSDTASFPLLGESQNWSEAVRANLPADASVLSRLKSAARRRLVRQGESAEPHPRRQVNWMPAMSYRPHWRSMRAFALPSFYDGRIRVNLAGRETGGRVPVSDYEKLCDEIEAALRECRDPATGAEVVAYVERVGGRDPLGLGPTESDMVVVWKGTFCALEHPAHGTVGPVPFRRTGGHTGRYGMAYLCNAGMEIGDRGVRSSFDVAPTLCELLGEVPPEGLSGASLLR
ncbi:MAG: alkaline phosphatase family protein [Acidobacteria bacterium]|nr:alkaline phosphatase family protein [Acidobacteriota bacterium]